MNNDDFEAEKLEKEQWEADQLDFIEKHPFLSEDAETIKQYLLEGIIKKLKQLPPRDTEGFHWWMRFKEFINEQL